LVIEEGSKGDKKMLVLNLGMNVCEAVIGYLVKIWAETKDQLGRKVMAVFKTYGSFQDHLKVCSQLHFKLNVYIYHEPFQGCKRPTKKKDPNNTVNGSQGANPRKRGRPGGSSSSTAVPKEKGAKEIGGVSMSPVLDFECIKLLLELLFG
jgi:hypothetical protein